MAVGAYVALDVTQGETPNFLHELCEAVRDYCEFLDKVTAHFAQRIEAQIRGASFQLRQELDSGCVSKGPHETSGHERDAVRLREAAQQDIDERWLAYQN